MEIAPVASIWVQLQNACFLSSGFFGDILVLRFLLMFAYIFLLVNTLLGFPVWPQLWHFQDFKLSIDTLVWAGCNLYLHGSGFLGIFRDERYVRLSEEMEPLWRLMYRKAGLSALVFKKLVSPKFQIINLSENDAITDANSAIYIIRDGIVKLTDDKGNVIFLPSGGVVGLEHLHLFSHRDGRKDLLAIPRTTTCFSNVTAYRCTKEDMISLATTSQTKLAWQALLIHGLTEFGERVYRSLQMRDEDENIHAAEISAGHLAKNGTASINSDQRNEVFAPLEDWELPNPLSPGSGRARHRPVRHLLKCAIDSFLPPWPFYRWVPALRHDQLPAPHFMPRAPSNGGGAPVTSASTNIPVSSDFPPPVPGRFEESLTETISETVIEVQSALVAAAGSDESPKEGKSDLEEPLLPK